MTTDSSVLSPIFPSDAQIQSVRAYIQQTWETLTRSHTHLLQAAQDSKVEHRWGNPWIVYLSQQEDLDAIARQLKKTLSPEEWNQIELRKLPDRAQIQEHGLLYLPHAYVVPGGRFNEMYGWDSYFMQLGLLRDGQIDLAKNMVEQLVYEVEHYGTVLNSNRTYMLGRSQPPVLTRMVLALFEQTQDRVWLEGLLPAVERFYQYWRVSPRSTDMGLSRFYAVAKEPLPEVVFDEKDDQGRTHYDRVRAYYRQFNISDYDVTLYYDRAQDRLTELFYTGDCSMRESGFDISNRFGPFSVDIIHYAPVCLNALLYQMECDTAQIYQILNQETTANLWRDRAHQRHQLIDRFLWDQEAGLYLDYHLDTKTRRYYEFATTFYPLWVGIASIEQAKRVAENLDRFEAPGGLLTSTCVSGNQWDAPFGWAPLQLIAVQGLCRYGYVEAGHRIARKFVALLVQEFEKQGTLVEKYDVCSCSSDVSQEILFGYSSNEVGFGWTNGVFLELLAILGL
ncbi:trehalase family glycosidase [Phormidesmis sp. 146-35]